MEKFICIHGHFYQPPRENPWLEAVELQDSAYPYHDWNERITAECYGPNASSRILDERRRIEKIVNNYSRISFNFGPTLLSWLQQHSTETYKAILDADRQSRDRFSGHGSALAQAYNHLIMPLANMRDKMTQVVWGLRDFEHRFHRQAEGMWLPETAVDVETLEVLAAHGVRFTILEPHQALRTRKIGDATWTDVTGGKIDPSRAYAVHLPSGRSIAVFFYDGPISRSVAFDNLLSNGEHFARRLLGAFSPQRSWPQVVNIATDGETYGHHHRFGDMALAYALHTMDTNGLGRLTNYGEFLERFPPQHEVEIVERTAWSCAHGIERWRANCGCRTGGAPGWNQEWRGPLRDALDWLRDRLTPIFENAARNYLRDPWAARDDYIRVVLDRSDDAVTEFLKRNAVRELSPDETVVVLELMEMQRHAMLMYTSCGWFFNEVSGIETVQVLQYAARAIQLAEAISGESIEESFRGRLERARSNIPEYGSARQIYESTVRKLRIELQSVAAHYAVASVFRSFPASARIYGYEVEREEQESVELGRARVIVGAIRVTSEVTRESARFSFAVLYLGDVHLTGGIKPFDRDQHHLLSSELIDGYKVTDFTDIMRVLDRHFVELTLSIKSLFRDDQRATLAFICNATLLEAEAALRRLHDRYLPLMRFHLDLGVPLPKVLQEVAEFDLNLLLRRAFEQEELPFDMIESLLRRVKSEQLSLDETSLAFTLEQTIDRIANQFSRVHDLDNLRRLEAAVELALELPFDVDLREVQNIYYNSRSLLVPDVSVRAAEGDEEAGEWLSRFRSLGEKLSFREV